MTPAKHHLAYDNQPFSLFFQFRRDMINRRARFWKRMNFVISLTIIALLLSVAFILFKS